MSDAWVFAIAAASFVLSAAAFYGAAAQANNWWPWTKWVSAARYRVAPGKVYEIQRDWGRSWYEYPWAVMHPHGGCVDVTTTYWGAQRVLRRAMGSGERQT